MCSSSVYNVWQHMLRRCADKDDQYYGGRGITVCDRWKDFETFYADMGDPPEGCSIERKDVDGNYEPSNCTWATKTQQAANKRNNRVLSFQGRTMHISAWARDVGLSISALSERLSRGWPVELALSTPPKTRHDQRVRFK